MNYVVSRYYSLYVQYLYSLGRPYSDPGHMWVDLDCWKDKVTSNVIKNLVILKSTCMNEEDDNMMMEIAQYAQARRIPVKLV